MSDIFERNTVQPIATITSNTTLPAWGLTVPVDCTSGNITITLPQNKATNGGSAQTSGNTWIYKVDASANTITVVAQSGNTIANTSSIVINAQNEGLYLLNGDLANIPTMTNGGGSNPNGYPLTLTTDVTQLQWIVGLSETSTSPQDIIIKGIQALGSNIAGADINYYASNSTGSKDGGNFRYFTSVGSEPMGNIAVGSANYGNGSGLSFSYTQTIDDQPNKILIIGVQYSSNSAQVSSVTINGRNAIFIKRQNSSASGSNAESVECWNISSPSAGDNTIVVTFNSSVVNATAISAVYYNVNLSNPINNSTVALSSNPTTSAAIPVSSIAGQMIVDIIGTISPAGAIPTGLNQISVYNSNPPLVCTSSYQIATTTLTTNAYTFGANTSVFAMIGIAINPYSNGVGPTDPNQLINTTTFNKQGIISTMLITGRNKIITSGGSTGILNNSPSELYFTGTQTHTAVLPSLTTLLKINGDYQGSKYSVFNQSTQSITINNYESTQSFTVLSGQNIVYELLLTGLWSQVGQSNILTLSSLPIAPLNSVLCNPLGTSSTPQYISINTGFNQSFETSNAALQMNGTSFVGSSNNVIRSNHVHPTDTSRMALVVSPVANNFLYDNSSGQAIDSGISLSTSSTANLNTQLMSALAIQTAISNAIISGENFRGGYNASTNLFPSTGGSGAGGTINAGDWWRVTTAGTLGGVSVLVNDNIYALVINPTQTSTNWSINQTNVASVNGQTGLVSLGISNMNDVSFSTFANGQIPIYNTSTGKWNNSTLTGTANQLIVTNSAGGITLSTPQNINTSATPTFSSMTLTNGLTIQSNTNQLFLGTTNVMTITMSAQTTNHTFTLPNANSNPIQSVSSAPTNQVLQYIDSLGVQNFVQLGFSNLSGVNTVLQGGSGVTTKTGDTALVLNNGPTLNHPTISDYQSFTAQTTIPTFAKGDLFYDNANDCMAYYNSVGEVLLGKESVLTVLNSTGSTIPAGSVVYINGITGGIPTIALANASSNYTNLQFLYITVASISNTSNGTVINNGVISGINTSSLTTGATLYLDYVTSGNIVTTPPTAPNYAIKLGICQTVNATTGSILVNIVNLIIGNGIVSAVNYANNLSGGSASPFPYQSDSQVTSYYNAQQLINVLANGVTIGQYLRGNGSNIILSNIIASDVPTLNQNTTGTANSANNIVSGVANQLLVQTGVGVTGFINNANNGILTTGATGIPNYISYAIFMSNASAVNPSNTWYVNNVNGNDSNNGLTPQTAFASLAGAQTTIGSGQGVIKVFNTGASNPYTETTTLSTLNNVTIMSDSYNGSLLFSNTITINNSSSSLSIKGIAFANLVKQGAGSLYLYRSSVTNSFSNTGSGYFQASFNSDFQGSGSVTNSFTGSGISVIDTGSYVGILTINNASAKVGLTNISNSNAITLTAGVLSINNATIYSTSTSTNAITVSASAGTNALYCTGVQCVATGTNTPSLINIGAGSYYSFAGMSYNPTGSTVAGSNAIARTFYYDAINLINSLPITSGGTNANTANGAFNNLAPSQAGNTNKVLTTNATNTSWNLLGVANFAPIGANTYLGNNTTLSATPIICSAGSLTETGSSVLTLSTSAANSLLQNATIQVKQSSSSQSGYLSSTDWSTFNGKQNALTNPVTSSSASPVSGQVPVYTGTGTNTSPANIGTPSVEGFLTVGGSLSIGNIVVRIATYASGAGIQISTVSGSMTADVMSPTSTYTSSQTLYNSYLINATITTTPANPLGWAASNAQGNLGTIYVNDHTTGTPHNYTIFFILGNNSSAPASNNFLQITQGA